jgi:hypothetical protein
MDAGGGGRRKDEATHCENTLDLTLRTMQDRYRQTKEDEYRDSNAEIRPTYEDSRD